jgi:2-oxoglutarate ferredoxin oxidoreductase subunit alpha
MFDKEISIVLSGEAGQGLNTIELLFMTLLKENGYHAFLSKEFMSRVRGGNNTAEIRVSSENVNAFVDSIDILFVLCPDGTTRLEHRLTSRTIIIGESKYINSKYSDMGCTVIPLDSKDRSAGPGGKVYSNIYIIGILSGLFSFDQDTAQSLIRSRFTAKGDDIISKNLFAYQQGVEASKQISIPLSIKPDAAIHSHMVLSGTEAIGIGAIAGGCNFIASYPMSPSTGVLVYLAKRSRVCGVAVEQTEDEIAAINMILGAWYAGARGMVTTSGGGFALMTEGLSLAGCIESPAVIHLAQRPGPATGLPTRTEQGDLNLAVYGGHGDFPRIIYAPGTLTDAITLTKKAFDVADQFQVPVILLTDQYFLDSIGTTEKIDFSQPPGRNHICETSGDYKRYATTPSGISPRGIPGYGKGFICVDSDEHSEDGRITEDFNVRVSMVDKRMRKLTKYNDIEPELIGNPDYSILIIGWGSNYGVIIEILDKINHPDIAFAYFKQVFPVPRSTGKLLAQAKMRIVIENNATGQFGKLLELETLLNIHKKIVKYNGMPFSVEELVTRIRGELKL